MNGITISKMIMTNFLLPDQETEWTSLYSFHYCVTQLKLYLNFRQAEKPYILLSTPHKISTFFNTHRHKSLILTLYHPVPRSTNLKWTNTNKYQSLSPYADPVPSLTNLYNFIIHHLALHSWANWIMSFLTTHFMHSIVQYTWSCSFF